jgi:hypothetical protein
MFLYMVVRYCRGLCILALLHDVKQPPEISKVAVIR